MNKWPISTLVLNIRKLNPQYDTTSNPLCWVKFKRLKMLNVGETCRATRTLIWGEYKMTQLF